MSARSRKTSDATRSATCSTCPFFSFFEVEADKAGDLDVEGRCRVDPPKITDLNGESAFGDWPIVNVDDWCSLHPERCARGVLAYIDAMLGARITPRLTEAFRALVKLTGGVR